jgi:hypothetical protein
MSGSKRRETGSGKEISEEVKLAKRLSLQDHTEHDFNRLEDELRRLGEDAPPDLVDRLPEAHAKVDKANKHPTEYNVTVASSFVATLLFDVSITGIGVISGSRKGARKSGIDSKERQARLKAMREWLGENPEHKSVAPARFIRDMADKWDIEPEAAKKFIYRYIDKLNG